MLKLFIPLAMIILVGCNAESDTNTIPANSTITLDQSNNSTQSEETATVLPEANTTTVIDGGETSNTN
uniref:hypothetical protein n=1 Tax=Vibrio penaeicida TaxID=104609 RepID=UPI0011AB4982